MSETAVTSFIIRFKQEQTGSPTASPWRGFIRHVQTSEETHFTDIQEALSFMDQFIKIDQPGTPGDQSETDDGVPKLA